MNTTIRGHYLRVTRMIALLAVMLLLAVALVFALPSAPTTSDRDLSRANHAMSAEDTGGSTITKDPNIERHAEVVHRSGNGSLR
jgi:hypothetical protein